MPSSLLAEIERARARFRQDVADQLRMAADKAGLPATVTLDDERAVLEFDDGNVDGPLPRIVAAFSDHSDAEPRGFEGLSLWVETDDERTTLLTLAWHDDPGLDEKTGLQRRLSALDAWTDASLPLERRGLNAAADRRSGSYARGDAVRQLAADFKRTPTRPPAPERSRALVAVERLPTVPAEPPARDDRVDDMRSHEPQRPPAFDPDAQRANLSELLIASLMQTLQRDLVEAEAYLVRPGFTASLRGRFGRAMEWAMLGTAYGAEAQTNQIAVSSFLGGGAASWLYGLVGPVLIGGLAYVSKSRLGKGAAYGLMISWALAMASVTASDKSFLDRAQEYFPKQAVVLTHEQAAAAARLKKEAAEAETKRLSAPAKQASELLAEAENRWQAAEIKKAAERESAQREKDRAKARQAAIDAGVALNAEELRLRDAVQTDPSRAWAWWTLFAIFGVINLAGPLAIARVLERWRADHAEALASAREGHRTKSASALLRGSRSAQKAHAMLLLPALLDRLKHDGVAPEVIAGLDLADISQKAAERFDRGINGKPTAGRSYALRRTPEGPT